MTLIREFNCQDNELEKDCLREAKWIVHFNFPSNVEATPVPPRYLYLCDAHTISRIRFQNIHDPFHINRIEYLSDALNQLTPGGQLSSRP